MRDPGLYLLMLIVIRGRVLLDGCVTLERQVFLSEAVPEEAGHGELFSGKTPSKYRNISIVLKIIFSITILLIDSLLGAALSRF